MPMAAAHLRLARLSALSRFTKSFHEKMAEPYQSPVTSVTEQRGIVMQGMSTQHCSWRMPQQLGGEQIPMPIPEYMIEPRSSHDTRSSRADSVAEPTPARLHPRGAWGAASEFSRSIGTL